MSSPHRMPRPDRRPFIAVVDRASRALQSDMVREAQSRGYEWAKYAHNAVFGTLGEDGDRATDMATRAGITRQSMGEIIRELVGLGILEMQQDPADRRAKLVKYTAEGKAMASTGYEHIIDLERRFAEEFGQEEYDVARRVLERVADILDEVHEEDVRRLRKDPA
jgi:DNA-binding MarR family transcriptional regulator